MAYTYRFVDTNENVIYVGYTGQTMAKRISQHFTKGHLPKKCYKSIARIDYIKWDSKSDAQVMEVYYINKYHPKFNKLDKQGDRLNIQIEDEKEWEVYQVIKKPNIKYEAEDGILTWIMIGALVYAIISFFI
ncbi:MAG: GIY-YIG nuclease family protein [Terrisporobacter sp.]|uniref:GIY-YIG nuclease family protein n=1 Tax=Terrisporobacter sp. TaxID=1965305 RepID=UPI002A91B3EE|nr:GIY-YIG nuclease family protein [Terrisporobacter sp.]MDY6152955.1 GIY-YIG nuclease family protein [Terrisporobacter sp.]